MWRDHWVDVEKQEMEKLDKHYEER